MPMNQTFRSAFNGFNREDVVRYIEYLNNQHNAQIARMNTELEELRAQLAASQEVPAVDNSDLELQLEQAQDRCAELEQELAEIKSRLNNATAQENAKPTCTDELEAYRRAERAERLARERAEQLYAQANGALAEATTLVDQAASQIGTMANDMAAQMTAFRDAVIGTKSVLANAAAAMYTIRPCGDEPKK